MRVKIPLYTGAYRIISLASDEETRRDLWKDKLDFIALFEKELVLYPDRTVLTKEEKIIDKFQSFNNYDVFELLPNGILSRCYDAHSLENHFIVTEKCNSNCIICPSSNDSRMRGQSSNIEALIEIARHIPTNTPHLTITGGEPFLLGEQIFDFIAFLKQKFHLTEFLFLTNGRIFSIEKYVQLLMKSIPNNTIIGIPIHSATKEVHDCITKTKGSFDQTFSGLKRLLNCGARIELRIVVNKINVYNLMDLARLIISELSEVEYVSIIAMEMTGSAYANKDKIWMPYRKIADMMSNALMCLIVNGINVRLYNFPLCTVRRCFWPLCEKSISSEKVRYSFISLNL